MNTNLYQGWLPTPSHLDTFTPKLNHDLQRHRTKYFRLFSINVKKCLKLVLEIISFL